MLVGQVLPLCAVLQGIEALHAGVVSLDGRAVALAGPSGAGKSTLAATLLARGAEFVADDVAALEARDDGVVVHPGTGLLNLRAGAVDHPPGVVVDPGDGGLRVLLSTPSEPLPLVALVHLVPAAELSVDSVTAGSAQVLLGSNYVPGLRAAARLERLLDLCALVARQATVLRLTVPRGAEPDRVAAALLTALGITDRASRGRAGSSAAGS